MKLLTAICLSFLFFVITSTPAQGKVTYKPDKQVDKHWPTKNEVKKLTQAKGKSEKEVLKLLGPPYRKETRKDGTVIWYYPWLAAAYVAFKDGKAVYTFYTAGY